MAFDPAGYTTLKITLDGTPMEVRRYRAVHVGKPVEMAPMKPAGRINAPEGETAVVDGVRRSFPDRIRNTGFPRSSF